MASRKRAVSGPAGSLAQRGSFGSVGTSQRHGIVMVPSAAVVGGGRAKLMTGSSRFDHEGAIGVPGRLWLSLVQADAELLDHVRPIDQLGFGELGELGRRHVDRVGAAVLGAT